MKVLRTIVGVGLLLAGLTSVEAGDFSLWAKKMPIQFAGYNRSERLTNFPALVVFNPTLSGFSYADFNGTNADLRFADATQTNELNYEVDKWDTTSNSYIWVQVPVLTNNATIWAYWGRSGTNAPACTTNGAVWSSTYRASGI